MSLLRSTAVQDTAAAPSPLARPFVPASPTPDPTYSDVVYAFSGSDEGGGWMINGETFPDVTIESFPLGSEVIIEVRNLSPTEHPFHLHGHAFEVLSVEGVAPAQRRVEEASTRPSAFRCAAGRGGRPGRLDGPLPHPVPRRRRRDDRAAS